ncbi:hypothetical protein ABFV74_01125 [Pseudoalteromonas distincta]|nr:hypothetical protein [Pseudoalteromonas sp. NSLLW218]MBH0090042.1 hypothetical protein [Pseudoalteromonas sp. NSLLW218]
MFTRDIKVRIGEFMQSHVFPEAAMRLRDVFVTTEEDAKLMLVIPN